MREQFEKLPEIAKLIDKGAWWSNDVESYDAELDAEVDLNELHFMDGAWYAFQELHKSTP